VERASRFARDFQSGSSPRKARHEAHA
jgi:hypothetical protein